MYNPFFSRAFAPGFNVKPQDDVPGFDVRPQDAVPGFNIDENGMPRRDRTWSDGMRPASATPPGVRPVNCTTVSGSMRCMSPLGESFDFPPSPGFPQRLDPGVDDYHGYDVPDGSYPASGQTLTQHIVNRPTPGPERLVRPATPEGTLNEATPGWLYDYLMGNAAASGAVLPPDGLISPVKSYLRTDQNGRQIVVNATQPDHLLHPGYVARYVSPLDGGSTIHNEGEGSGSLQGSISQRIGLADLLNHMIWSGLYRRQTGGNTKRP